MTLFENRIYQKIGAVALAALLLFNNLAPIPIGVHELDEMRYEEANAVPALAIPVIVGTLLTACGVYVAGTTMVEYNGNLETLSEAFVDWCADHLYHEDIDAASAAISAAVTEAGKIDFAALAAAGITGAIPGFAAYLVSQGNAINGANTTSAISRELAIGDYSYKQFKGRPVELANLASYANSHNNEDLAQYASISCWAIYWNNSSGESKSHGTYTASLFFFNDAETIDISLLGKKTTIYFQNLPNNPSFYFVQYRAYSDGYYDYAVGFGGSVTNRANFVIDAERSYIATGVDVSSTTTITSPAVVDSAVTDGTYSYPTTGVYEPFAPTSDQLANGYDSTAAIEAEVAEQGATISELQERITANANSIAATNARVGALETSVDGLRTDVNTLQSDVDALNVTVEMMPDLLAGILDAVNPLNGNLVNILGLLSPLSLITNIASGVASIVEVATGIAANPFGWLLTWWNTLSGWWASLLDWLGDVGALGMVTAVTGAISTLWDNVSAWMGATPIGVLIGGVTGALEGWWTGLLDWLGDTPLAALIRALQGAIVGAIEGLLTGDISLAGVLDAIASIPSSIADALAGVLEGVGFIPSLDLGEPTDPRAVDAAKVGGFESQIASKAPWAYMVALFGLLSSLRAWNDTPSFVIDWDMPNIGDGIAGMSVHADMGDFLLQSFNGLTVAFYIRSLLTITLCVGLLMFSYKVLNLEAIASIRGD